MLWVDILLVAFVAVLLYSGLPNLVIRVFRWFVVVKGPRRKEVALTFDDGPDGDYTPALLDELARNQLVATFFVLAERALEYPSIIERMVQEGHDVQIHGWSHKPVPLMMPSETLKQMAGASEALNNQFHVNPSLYRPPWGLCNLISLVRLPKQMKLVTWSVMVGDWRITAPDELQRRIMRKLHKGAVIVLHDSDKTPGAQIGAPREVIALMPLLARTLRTEGFEFVLMRHWLEKKMI